MSIEQATSALAGLNLTSGELKAVTKRQYEAALILKRSGKSLASIFSNRPGESISKLAVGSPDCAYASHAGGSGTLSSYLVSGSIYNITVNMYNPSLYTSYNISVSFSGTISNYYQSSINKNIPRGAIVDIDAAATGPNYTSLGYLRCYT